MNADEELKATLFNDIAAAPRQTWVPLDEHEALCDHLWDKGWRRNVATEDQRSLVVNVERRVVRVSPEIAAYLDPSIVVELPPLEGS